MLFVVVSVEINGRNYFWSDLCVMCGHLVVIMHCKAFGITLARLCFLRCLLFSDCRAVLEKCAYGELKWCTNGSTGENVWSSPCLPYSAEVHMVGAVLV